MKHYLFIFILFITYTCTSKEKLAIMHGPFLQHQGETGVTIIWTTNKEAVSWVEVTTTHNGHENIAEKLKYYSAAYKHKEPKKVHHVRINNLKPGTTYHYTVCSQIITNNPATSNTYQTISVSSAEKNKPLKFHTVNPLNDDAISFIAVNDIHGHPWQLRNLLKKADYPSADLIVFNGDMVNTMKNENQYFNDLMNTAISMFAREKPMYYARGNHETLGNYADAFPDYFKSPDGKLYYLLRRGPVCFIILDSGEYLDDGIVDADADRVFDSYRDRECEWLAEAIKTHEFTEAPFRVAVIHIPPIGTWHGAVEVANKFVPLLNKANIDIMLCGHLHRYFYRTPDKEIQFPVLVNSNNTVLRAEADSASLRLQIISKKGREVDLIEVKR